MTAEDRQPLPVMVTLLVVDALESLSIPYAIGGSFASAWHGVARATLDSDLVADLQPQHTHPFVAQLQDIFYVDETAAGNAIARRSSFNLIHLETMFKVDIFVAKQRPFDQAQLRNATRHVIATEPERSAYIASAEDTILAKLDWYRLGGEVSERQWRDVVGVATMQRDTLDWRYMQEQAATLHITDLLQRLRQQLK